MIIFNIVLIVLIIVVFYLAFIKYKKSKEVNKMEINHEEVNKPTSKNIKFVEKEVNTEFEDKNIKNNVDEIEKKYGIVTDPTITDEEELDGQFEEVHE